jgi:hypothetical protein
MSPAAQHGMQPTGFASLRSARQRLMPPLGGQVEISTGVNAGHTTTRELLSTSFHLRIPP